MHKNSTFNFVHKEPSRRDGWRFVANRRGEDGAVTTTPPARVRTSLPPYFPSRPRFDRELFSSPLGPRQPEWGYTPKDGNQNIKGGNTQQSSKSAVMYRSRKMCAPFFGVWQCYFRPTWGRPSFLPPSSLRRGWAWRGRRKVSRCVAVKTSTKASTRTGERLRARLPVRLSLSLA